MNKFILEYLDLPVILVSSQWEILVVEECSPHYTRTLTVKPPDIVRQWTDFSLKVREWLFKASLNLKIGDSL